MVFNFNLLCNVRIRFLFIGLVMLLLGLAAALALMARDLPWQHLCLLEGIIAGILLYLIFFHKRVLKPLHCIDNGIDLLCEQDFSSRLSKVGQYEADRIVHVFNRMMEQLKNERLRLHEQNRFLDLLIEASPMGVIILNFSEKVTQINPAAARLLGVSASEILGKPLSQCASPSMLVSGLLDMKLGENREIRLSDANIYKCTYAYFIDQGLRHPFYLIECMTDEVMHAEKKAYGKVIRMIVHEVNNTTAGITSTLDTVEQALADEAGMEELCEVMRVCIERCYSMSQFITRFADVVKIPEPMLAPASINELVLTCRCFMENICNERNISLKLNCDPQAGKVMLDSSLIEQVLVNIIKNAMESIDHDGNIVITTLAPKTLEIADNGPGIDPDTAGKLFTPFYSTKPHGQGIGLVFIREVLVRHGCTFSLRTYEDGWTRFRISF